MNHFRFLVFIFGMFLFFNFSSVSFALPEKTVVALNKDDGRVDFYAVGTPSLLRIHGKGQGAQGKFSVVDRQVTGEGSFNLSSLETGIEMRDYHMKEKYLEVEKYPSAVLKISQMTLPEIKNEKNWILDKVPFTGTLLLHGQTQNISGTSKVSRQEQKIKVECDFSINLKDFGISLPTFAGITVANNVTVHVSEASVVTDNK